MVHFIEESITSEYSFVFLERSLTIQSPKSKIQFQFEPRAGYQYHIELSSFETGLFITHSEIKYTFLLPLLAVLHCVTAFVLFRLESDLLCRFLQQSFERISFCLIAMYAQVGTVLTVYQALLVIEYVLHFSHFLGKIMAYSLFGLGFLLGMVQTAYAYVLVQRKIEVFLPEGPSLQTSTATKLYRLTSLLIIFCGGLLGYPLLLTLFHKGVWFSYFCLMGLAVQFFSSKHYKAQPHHRFTSVYLLEVIYLTLLSNYYPLFNFHEISRINFLIFLTFALLSFFGGSYYLKVTVHEISLREEEPATQQNWKLPQAKQQQSLRTEEMIRSDIELDSRAI